MSYNSYIRSTGSYLPNKCLTNDDLSKTMETSDEWIFKRTGIKERHIADKSEMTSDLAFNAAKVALNRANISVEEIDLIICATVTPDLTFPSTATIVQQKLNASKAFAFDMSAACSGFVYALATADNFIKNGQIKNALVIGAEVFSRILDWNDRSTCVLFGDGAGAVVLSRTENKEKGIIKTELGSDGSLVNILKTNGGTGLNQISGYVEMDGKAVFKFATSKLLEITKRFMEEYKIDYVLPHQANIRIIDYLMNNLQMTEEQFIVTIKHHANTSAASIPLALDTYISNGHNFENKNIFLTSIGAGITWGGILISM